MKKNQLFYFPKKWELEWLEMPEYVQENQPPFREIIVNFRNENDIKDFGRLIEQTVTSKTKSLWYPKTRIGEFHNDVKRYVSDPINPKYPVYIISKGRWDNPLTSKALERMQVPYKIVIEPQEYDDYAINVDPKKILILPFSNLGQGSIPARNWVWNHSIFEGHTKHWVLDDNIRLFRRLNRNMRLIVESGAIFRAAEDFTDRYENVPVAGFQYTMFAPIRQKLPAYYLNTRVYSCLLIQNDCPFRWRGRYNEDTDLSLRVLKAGQCTILFNAFLCKKLPTMTMKGGNTDELYMNDGRKKMTESLIEQHPDVVKMVWKHNRHHHLVNYKPFRKNKLIRKSNLKLKNKVNNYTMKLIEEDSQ